MVFVVDRTLLIYNWFNPSSIKSAMGKTCELMVS